jgi:methionyl-tRNA formyltransferase
VPLVGRALPRLAAGTLGFTPQDEAAATYCRKLEKEDGTVDFTAPASVVAARINGLFPWPGCAIELNGQSVKLGQADVSELSTSLAPGTVLGSDETGLLVATGDGVLRLRRLQRPGGRMLPAADFLRGFPVATGVVIPSRPMPVLVSAR